MLWGLSRATTIVQFARSHTALQSNNQTDMHMEHQNLQIRLFIMELQSGLVCMPARMFHMKSSCIPQSMEDHTAQEHNANGENATALCSTHS